MSFEKIENKVICIAEEVQFELPDSWKRVRLGSILTKLTDGTHSTSKYTQAGIPFLSVKDIGCGFVDLLIFLI